ncbi:MAG: thermonuclease family protein [Planctomycetia bacterium]|nr:thermonuclease family protein [Planctomycetia bacterium]
MARRQTFDRRVAREVVGTILSNKSRKNQKGQGGLAAIASLLVVVGLMLARCDQTEETRQAAKDAQTAQEQAQERPDVYTNDGGLTQYDAYDSAATQPDVYDAPDALGVVTITTALGSGVEAERVMVERCVDGDTIIVNDASGERIRVRFIGADTPETVKKNWPVEPWGPEASAYTKKRVADAGNVVYLVTDGSKLDIYGRRLAFVYFKDDPISLNEDLVRHGLARAQTQYSFSKAMKTRITAAAEAAQREGLGIYSTAN